LSTRSAADRSTATGRQIVRVELGSRTYEILIGAGLLERSDILRHVAVAGATALLVTNDTVDALYGRRAEAFLATRFARVTTVILPDGEAFKTWQTMGRIFDALLAQGHDRKTTIVALGGGVVGDIAGFAAACYMRGVDYIQLPTTLLAQVDSSVGGKTAVNHPAGKNMIGAFHQPRLVIADIDVLRTLPRRELIAGLAEVIKYGAALDETFLNWIEINLARLLALDGEALMHAVRRSCEIKAEIVASDERESGQRALLNFGHTFAHAIEAGLGYGRWLHGEAVGCGMVLAARLSARLGRIDPERAARLESIIERAGLPTKTSGIEPRRLVELMRTDKKALEGSQRFVLLDGADGAVLASAPEELVEQVLLECCSS
jgi:3-dehydroquinate synthase